MDSRGMNTFLFFCSFNSWVANTFNFLRSLIRFSLFFDGWGTKIFIFFCFDLKKTNLCFFVFILHAHYLRLQFFQIFATPLCCTWKCLRQRGLSCTKTSMENLERCCPRDLSCIWTCLCQRGLSCTWTCLHYRGPGASVPVYATGAAAAHGLVWIAETCAVPGLIYTTEACAAP